ncbi:histidine kinase [Sphingosinicella sp. CPCC 101087]|uniref:sensor histidine kinase n=1 Tax=Sphingosinicella sp. CPCC 101087 TaxID=2497754 RepID=UPI00101D65E6|nr:histidine kinase [Sphingosinicella sp. CPCC 101087]
MAGQLRRSHRWISCIAALAVWLALGWPSLQALVTGTALRGSAVPAVWLVPFTLFGAAVVAAMVLNPRTSLRWTLLCAQLSAVLAMTVIAPRSPLSIFLCIIAWQVAMATTPAKALAWVAFQTLAIIGTLALASNAGLSYVVGLAFVLQLCFVFTARALRVEAATARTLARANAELRSAQAIIANTVREAERLRISRELHDAWGHELTALGLQLEIASHVAEPGRANDHVSKAKGLAGALLAKVRDAVATLREAERGDSRDGPWALAHGVRAPAIHVPAIDVDVSPDARPGMRHGSFSLMAGHGSQHYWFFCCAALAVCLALGWPVLQTFTTGTALRGSAVPALWLVAFALFGGAVAAAMVLKLRTGLRWTLLCVQLAAVVAMALVVPWAMMSVFLIIIAWQVAMATTPLKALAWVAFQTLAIVGTLALAPKPDFCWVLGKSFALQLCFVFTAQALRMGAETARALARTNAELQSAQAIIANTVRNAERLRISRELHDAWGHELTALGLQLEIASHVAEPGRANDHVRQAKGLAGALLAKVRDVVATLREAERCDLKDALEALAKRVPVPAIHVDVSPDVRVSPDQAHALMRCAQEAVTNAVRHAQAANLWLQVTSNGEGVRLVARNDGSARPAASPPGSGLLGMRERVESLGGRLAVRTGAGFGFTVEAWLPSAAPQAV